MIQHYIPVLKAKKNEFIALKNTKESRLDKLTPIFEIPNPNKDTKKYNKSLTPLLTYIKDISDKIADKFSGRTVFVDGYEMFDKTYDESGKHVLITAMNSLEELGVNTIPVAGYDRWHIPDYKKALCSLERDTYLIRLDKDAIEDAFDSDYFVERLQEVLDDLNVSSVDCIALIDFGDVSKLSIEEILNSSRNIVQVLQTFEFGRIALSGCSLPAMITEVVRVKDSTQNLLRKEMVVWKTIRDELKIKNLLFSDYGIRGPNSAVVSMSPNTNGKIRYAIPNECLISLGHSQQESDKWGQMKAVSKRVIDSGLFMGDSFSWGDEYIFMCSLGLAPTGSAQTWVAVDTNHHIAYVLLELDEHLNTEKSITSAKSI